MKHALKPSATHATRNGGLAKGVNSKIVSVSDLFMVIKKTEGIQFKLDYNLLRHGNMPEVPKPSMDSLDEMAHNFPHSTINFTK